MVTQDPVIDTNNIESQRNTRLAATVDENGNMIQTVGLVVVPTINVGVFTIDQTTPGVTNGVAIDQTTPGTTNGVVVNASALPTGAATDATVAAVTTALGAPAQDSSVQAITTALGAVTITGSALPTNAAQESGGNLDSISSHATNIDANTSGVSGNVASMTAIIGTFQNGTPSPPLTLTAQGAGTVIGADVGNPNFRGVVLGINVTLATTASVVFTLWGKDVTSGEIYTIAQSAAISSAGFSTLKVYPGITPVANAAVSDILPAVWGVSAVVTGVSAVVSAVVGASQQL